MKGKVSRAKQKTGEDEIEEWTGKDLAGGTNAAEGRNRRASQSIFGWAMVGWLVLCLTAF